MGFMFWIWISIMVVTVLIEISTTNLTSIWFSAGSLAALISNLFMHDTLIPVQIAIFAVISIVAIIVLKPIINKKLNKQPVATNVDSLFGKTAIVVDKIAPNFPGTIKIEGIEWTAVDNNDTLEAGDLVTIVSVEGNTLTVERKEK